MKKTEFTPAGPIAQAYFLDNSRVACILGPYASGKSSASCLRIKRHMHEQQPDSQGVRSTRWLIARPTYKNLRDSLLPTWKRWFPPQIYGEADSQMRHMIQGRLPDGTTLSAEVMFRAYDDPLRNISDTLSLELTGAWINECRELDFELAMAILARTKRWPAGDVRPTWSGMVLDSNCWASESPYHRAFVIDPRPGYTLFHQPSGVSPEAENLQNLEVDYYKNLESDLQAEPDKLATNVYSEFGQLRSGQVVYKSYTDKVHCKDFTLPNGAPLRLGIDFGIRACAAVVVHRSPVGQHMVCDEIVSFDQDLPSFCDAIKARLSNQWAGHPFEYGVADPAGNARNLSGQTAFDIARSRGLFLQPASTNELGPRIAAVGKLLTTMVSNGAPAFQLHPRCRWLRDAFLFGYRFAQQRGTGKIADTPEKNDHSHVSDALQYLALRCVGSIYSAHGGAAGVSHDQFLRGCAARGQQKTPDWSNIIFGNRETQQARDPRKDPFK